MKGLPPRRTQHPGRVLGQRPQLPHVMPETAFATRGISSGQPVTQKPPFSSQKPHLPPIFMSAPWGQESKLETNGPSRVGLFSHLLRLLFPEADLVVRLVMPALPERLGSGVLQL